VAPIGELANQVDATGVVVLDHDRELLTAGDPPAAVDCRSIRKPLLPRARQPQLAGPGPGARDGRARPDPHLPGQ
jgi:hypothetical protein